MDPSTTGNIGGVTLAARLSSAVLVGQYESDVGVQVNGAGKILAWRDLSGWGHHVTAGGGVAATLTANAANGFPAVTCTNADYFTSGSSITIAQPELTIAVVIKPTTLTANNSHDVFFDGVSNGTMILGTDTTPQTQMYAGTSLHTNADLPTSAFSYVLAIFNEGSSSLLTRTSGTNTTASGSAGSSTTVPTGWIINGNGALTRMMAAQYLGVFVYQGGLSSGDQTTLLAYVQAKWGLQ
jgi:hypothetical protein